MNDQTTREAIARAAETLTFSRNSGARDGWLCCFGSRHTDGPCKACVRAEARRASA